MRISRPQTEKTKRKISKSLRKYYPPFVRLCPECQTKLIYKDRHSFQKAEKGNTTCFICKTKREQMLNHFSMMGRISSASQNRRSKNEIRFAQLCKKFFKNVGVNVPMFNGWDADVIIYDKNVAVLWNGVWHYKKITKQHSLKQVKNRDKIKLLEIQKCGYIPYIVKDMNGKDYHFVEKEFEKFHRFLLTLG